MSKDKFSFKLLKENGFARLGKIYTSRGQIDTPTFMPVGTQGTIKSAFIEDIYSLLDPSKTILLLVSRNQ